MEGGSEVSPDPLPTAHFQRRDDLRDRGVPGDHLEGLPGAARVVQVGEYHGRHVVAGDHAARGGQSGADRAGAGGVGQTAGSDTQHGGQEGRHLLGAVQTHEADHHQRPRTARNANAAADEFSRRGNQGVPVVGLEVAAGAGPGGPHDRVGTVQREHAGLFRGGYQCTHLMPGGSRLRGHAAAHATGRSDTLRDSWPRRRRPSGWRDRTVCHGCPHHRKGQRGPCAPGMRQNAEVSSWVRAYPAGNE